MASAKSNNGVDRLVAQLRTQMADAPAAVDAAKRDLQLPPSCAGVFGVARSLLAADEHLTRFSQQLDVLDVDASTLRDWAAQVRAIPVTSPLRASEQLTRSDPGASGLGPVYGLATKRPVWCALWTPGQGLTPGDHDRFRCLQALYVVMYIRQQRGHGRPASEQRWREGGQFVRWMSRSTPTEQMVRGWLGDAVYSVESLRDVLADYRFSDDLEGRESLRQAMGALGEIVQRCGGLTPVQIFKPAGARSSRKRKRRRRKRTETQQDPAYSPYTHRRRDASGHTEWGHSRYTVRGYGPAIPYRDVLIDEGVDPHEWDEYGEVGIPLSALDTAGAKEQRPTGEGHEDQRSDLGEPPDPRTIVYRANAFATRIAHDAQRHRTDIRRISPHYLSQIAATLQHQYYRCLSAAPATKKEQRRQVILQSALRLGAVALATGTHPQDAQGLLVVDHADHLPEAEANYVLAYSPRHEVWVRPYDKPKRNPLKAVQEDADGSIVPRIVLPDLLGVGRGLSAKGRQSDLTDHRYGSYAAIWNEEMVPSLRAAGVPWSWCRLPAMGALLPSWMRGLEEGDHLSVALLFGQADLLAETHRYYTAYSREELARRYQSVVGELWPRIGPAVPRRPLHRLFDPDFSHRGIPRGWAGDDWVPPTAWLRDLIERAREAVRRADETGCAFAHHNRLTVYTALGLAVATGFRAIRTPIPDLRKVHRETRTLLLAEKDRSDGKHARLAVLPDVVFDQVDRYLRHLRAHIAELPMDSREEFEVRATKSRDFARSRGAATYTLSLRNTLYFWQAAGSKWRPVELTGRRLYEHAQSLVPGAWPVGNAGRHYLRTYLTNAGCPATAINALLGHWQYGEEPWCPESAMDPVLFRYTVLPYLNALMAEIGYIPTDRV